MVYGSMTGWCSDEVSMNRTGLDAEMGCAQSYNESGARIENYHPWIVGVPSYVSGTMTGAGRQVEFRICIVYSL